MTRTETLTLQRAINTERNQLQLDQAARGCVSGTLAEWPLLQAALANCGVNLPATADRSEMQQASAKCLGRPDIKPLILDQYNNNLLAHGIIDWRLAE